MDQRTQFIADYLRDSLSVSELCQLYGVSRKTAYKWIDRYLHFGPPGLAERSRRPCRTPNVTSPQIVAVSMALTTPELEGLSREVRRVLKQGGLNVYTVRHTGDPHYRTGVPRGENMYESSGGFIVHFFSRDKVERLAKDFQVISIDEFEEGALPRKLFRVTLRKASNA